MELLLLGFRNCTKRNYCILQCKASGSSVPQCRRAAKEYEKIQLCAQIELDLSWQ